MEERLSDLIGKELLTREGVRLGHILNVRTDAKLRRVRGLECFGEDEEEFSVPWSALHSCKEAAILKGNELPPAADGIPAPFGKRVYAADGALLGSVNDLVREGTKIGALLLSDGRTLPTEKVSGVQDAVLVNENKKTRAHATKTTIRISIRRARKCGRYARKRRVPPRRRKNSRCPRREAAF